MVGFLPLPQVSTCARALTPVQESHPIVHPYKPVSAAPEINALQTAAHGGHHAGGQK